MHPSAACAGPAGCAWCSWTTAGSRTSPRPAARWPRPCRLTKTPAERRMGAAMQYDPAITESDSLPPLARHAVHVFGERGLAPEGVVRDDTLASEVPVALVFNG